MNIVILALKCCLIGLYGDLIIRIIKAKKSDSTIHIALNLILVAEVSFVFGMSCISMTMQYSADSSFFVFPFIFINIILLYIETLRVLFVGKTNMLIKKQFIKLKQITNIESNLMFMKFYTTDTVFKVWMPITKFEYLSKNLLEGYVHKNMKRKLKRKVL